MRSSNLVLPACLQVLVIAALAGAIGDAQGITSLRVLSANPAGYCQAATPTFDGQIRKRPLALQNEGASNAFVTCAFARHEASNSVFRIEMFASTTSSGLTERLTCTLVAGIASSLDRQSISKTVTLPLGGQKRRLEWLQSDFSGAQFPPASQFSLTCNLLPGMGLHDSYVWFEEEVGQ